MESNVLHKEIIETVEKLNQILQNLPHGNCLFNAETKLQELVIWSLKALETKKKE